MDTFEAEYERLIGLASQTSREVLVAQLIESERRVRYIDYLRGAELQDSAMQPCSGAFDPLKAAVLNHRANKDDQACWQLFLSVHFGRNHRYGWELARRFYGRLGQGGIWDWTTVVADVSAVRSWLDANSAELRARGAGFGNHRKYESLNGQGNNGTGAAIESYIDWVDGSHAERFARPTVSTAKERFAALYESLQVVRRFGRTARFDYLATLGKLELADVLADRAYLVGATGPLRGARLLFAGDTQAGYSARSLEARLVPLQEVLGISFDILEDALCNWQKSPSFFVAFRG